MAEPTAADASTEATAAVDVAPVGGAKLGRVRSYGLIGLGAVAIAAAAWLGWRRARPPQRCAKGMVALGPRCCGRGQHLVGHSCAGRPLACAAGLKATPAGCQPSPSVVRLAGGTLQLGPVDWEASGRVRAHRAELAPFGIDSHEITEAAYRHCVDVGACAPLPSSGEPGLPQVNITAGQAARYCHWRGGALPTRDELAFAAMGAAGHRYPWGETGAVCRRVAFGLATGPCARGATGPEIAGSHPAGATAEGIYDLAGNAAEWTAPVGQHGEARGGSWRDGSASDLRAWSFVRLPPDSRSDAVGFRCSY